jgi:hypothetical protein
MTRATLVLLSLLVVPQAALAQFVPRFDGQTPSGEFSITLPSLDLPSTFAWYGDSIIQGACSSSPQVPLQQLLPGYVGVNRGISAQTSAQIAARYFAGHLTDCGGEECGTYLFEGGVNDCKGGGCDPASVLATMMAMVDDARTRHRRVIASNIAPFRTCAICGGGDLAAGWELAKQYNALFAAACAARRDITCIDVGAGSDWEEPATDGVLKSAWSCDGLHWQQAAIDALAARARLAFPP